MLYNMRVPRAGRRVVGRCGEMSARSSCSTQRSYGERAGIEFTGGCCPALRVYDVHRVAVNASMRVMFERWSLTQQTARCRRACTVKQRAVLRRERVQYRERPPTAV